MHILQLGRDAFFNGAEAAEDKLMFAHEVRLAQAEALDAVLRGNPTSAWAPSLHVNLGLFYREIGLYSRAMGHWEKAWELTNAAETGVAREMADFALAHYSRLISRLGRFETLDGLFLEHGNRRFSTTQTAQMWRHSFEAFKFMRQHPGMSYKCGTYAMGAVANSLLGDEFDRGGLFAVPSPAEGFSMLRLHQLSGQLGLRLMPVVRLEGDGIPVPSVAHMKENHYCAIIGKAGEFYKVADPTFGPLRYLTAEAINEEISGAFMVVEQAVPAGWAMLTPEQSAGIHGRGYANYHDGGSDHDCEGCCPPGTGGDEDERDDGEPPSGPPPGFPGTGENRRPPPNTMPVERPGGGMIGASSSGCGCGMAAWSVHEAYMNLWVKDTPMAYKPSQGPEMKFQLMYKQRTWGPSGGALAIGNNSWHCSWLSYVEDGGSPLMGHAYLGNGANYEVHLDSGSYTNYHSNARWTCETNSLGSVTNYTMTTVDGMVYVFDTEQEYYENISHLSSITDPQGRQITFQYGLDAYNSWVLLSVTDADGEVTELEYEPYTRYLTTVDGPYGTVELEYDGNAHLTNITDVVGIESSFTYDLSVTYPYWITNMATPYGATTFHFEQWDYVSPLDRKVVIEDPEGASEMYAYVWDCSAFMPTNYVSGDIPESPVDTLDTETRAHRNSFYWNKQQFPLLSTTNVSYMTYNDSLRGRMRHWLGDSPDFNHTISIAIDTLSVERAASSGEDGSGNPIPGQLTWYDYVDKGSADLGTANDKPTQIMPAVIARKMPDGSSWYQWMRRDDWGKVTNLVEKWTFEGVDYTRTNVYVYTNTIDLVEHRGPGNHLHAAYEYDSNHPHLPVKVKNALNEETVYTYYTSGADEDKLKTVTYPSGLISSNVYGVDGYLAKVVDFADGAVFRTNSYTWLNGNLRTHTDERGLTITYTHDALNRLTQVLYPDSTTVDYTYLRNGDNAPILDVGKVKDRLGKYTYFHYDGNRRMVMEVDALSRTNFYDFCACGALSGVTNAFGTSVEYVTTHTFDRQGKRLSTTRPGGMTVNYSYDLLGRITNVTDSLQSITNYFDNLGRNYKATTAFGQLHRSIYDDDDMVRTNIDANGVSTIMTYDDLHRLSTRTLAGGGTEAYGYTADISGPTSYTNQLGKVTRYEYNDLGWKTKEVYVGVATNSFTYNVAGDLRTLSDGKNQITKWGYDVYGRQTSKTNANNLQILAYAYDANSRLTNRWSVEKGNTAYGYDDVGNLLSINYPSSTDISYQYDALNRMTNMVDAVGTTYWYHDHANRQTVEDGPWASDNVTNKWNTAGLRERLGIQQPTSFFNTSYVYDAAKRLTNVTSGAGSFLTYYHTGLNSVTAPARLPEIIELPNGAYIDNLYDGQGRLTETALKQDTGTAVNAHAYQYNNAHQRTKQTRLGGEYVDYLYDDVGQVYSGRTYSSGGSELTAQKRGYKYDPAFNVNQRTNNTTVYTFAVDSLNQITTYSGLSFTYDQNGNMTWHGSGFLANVFDDENQLISSERAGLARGEFVYDGKNRLRKYVSYAWNGSWYLAGETRYIYDGMLQVQERNSGNTPTVTYTRGNDLSRTLQGAGGIGGLLARSHGYSGVNGSWSTHNFYHADGNGNITYLINSTQGLAASYKYDPFGSILSQSGTLANANKFRFSSKEYSFGGMYYYGYRWYDPNLQRWLNRDPVAEIGGINLHTFVGNAAVSYFDAFGLLKIGPPNNNEANSVVCDGKGGFMIEYSKNNPPNMAQCIRDCITAHEQEHINQFSKANPDLCKGKQKGAAIHYDDEKEQGNYEWKADQVEIDCLNNAKCNHGPPCGTGEINDRIDQKERDRDINKRRAGITPL